MKTHITEGPDGGFTMMRHGKNIKDMVRSFDIEFWQRQGTAAIRFVSRSSNSVYTAGMN